MSRLREVLGLEHNITIMLAIVMMVGLGEELWSRYIPKYLELGGATTAVIAIYGTLKDFLDAVYQYPGGWLADRLGRRRALAGITLFGVIGYLLYFFSSYWVIILLGTFFVVAWSSLASPAIFAIIGDNLPRERRSVGFSVQSIIKRVPVVVGPALGGVLISIFGFNSGIRIGLLAAVVLATLSTVIALRLYRDHEAQEHVPARFIDLWKNADPRLKRLLLADCFARWAEGIPDVFIVLFVINILHCSPFQFGWLTSLQMIVSIIVYLPVAKISDKLTRTPFIMLTFFFFALFPLMIGLSGSWVVLIIAFIVGGLREIGEPSRKALIVDLASSTARGRIVGMYYLIRGLAVFSASMVGGLLWTINPRLPFYAAFGVGIASVIIYAIIGNDKRVITTMS